MNRTARILAKTRIAGSLSRQKSRPAVAGSVAETATCIYVSGKSGLRWCLLKDRPEPVFKVPFEASRVLLGRKRQCDDQRPWTMVNGEAAGTVIMPVDAGIEIARKTRVEMTGVRITANDVTVRLMSFMPKGRSNITADHCGEGGPPRNNFHLTASE
jgi:hypothetical protein